MNEGYLETRGIAYRTNEFKDGRPTLLFIHGLSGSLSVWEPFEEKLQDRYNLVELDLRGHGKSRKYWGYSNYTINAFAEDIEALLTYLSIGTCVLISHSLGAIVALVFIRAHPEQVSRAIFISPALGTNGLLLEHLKHPWRLLGVLGAYLLAIFNVPRRGQRTDYVRYRATGDWNAFRAFADISRMGPLPYFFSLAHLYGFNDSKWWPAVTMPTLLIHGTADTMVPAAYAVALSKKIPIELVLLPKNHLLPMNSIDEVTRAIDDFIK